MGLLGELAKVWPLARPLVEPSQLFTPSYCQPVQFHSWLQCWRVQSSENERVKTENIYKGIIIMDIVLRIQKENCNEKLGNQCILQRHYDKYIKQFINIIILILNH